MYVLVEYSKNYIELENEVIKNKLIPIILFTLIINNKENILQQLKQIRKIKKENNFQNTAIKIIIEKHQNSNQLIINSLKEEFDLIIGFGGLNKTNRFFLEKTNIDFLMDPQNSLERVKIDFIHHLNSGINHILTKFAKNKNIDFIFSLNFTNNSNKFIIAKEIGRINQNLKFTRKYKVKSYINFIIKKSTQIKTLKEIQSISSLFDISTTQKQENLQILEQKIKNHKQNNNLNYINKNIQIIK